MKQKESREEERLKVLEVKKGKVGFDMGLKVFLYIYFFILSKMFNFCMNERLSAENLALALSCLFIGAKIDKN